MRLRIAHETHYAYAEPVRSLIQHLRLTPRDHDGQHVLHWRIEPTADGRLRPQEDSFGNVVHIFASDTPLEAMCVRVTGEVETSDTAGLIGNAVERLPAEVFRRETALTAPDPALNQLADDLRASFDADPLTGLHDLLAAVQSGMTFDTSPTQVSTTAAEAFALGRGVCQDLTHIFIAVARQLGAPARYVSGYFHRIDGVVEQEAGHAWAEARLEGLGWIGFDATNGISTTASHLRIAVGLDYLGAAPVRGSRTGGGAEELDVRLRVERVQEQKAQRQHQMQD